MSSGIDGGIYVAEALAAGAGVAVLAVGGTIAGGIALIEAGIDETNRRLRAVEAQRQANARSATEAYKELLSLGEKAVSDLKIDMESADPAGKTEIEAVIKELETAMREKTGNDADAIWHSGLKMQAALSKANLRHQQILSKADITKNFDGYETANIMDELMASFLTAKIEKVVVACAEANPEAVERGKLNARLSEAVKEVVSALGFIAEMEHDYTISKSNLIFFSMFNGVDEEIAMLSDPETSNKEVKRGIRDLEETVDRYKMLAPNLKKEKVLMDSLYDVYAEAAKNLMEKPKRKKCFSSANEIRAELKHLEEREALARQRAQLVQALGMDTYVSLAIDEELKAMGYQVRTKDQITEMADCKVKHAKLGDQQLPFYKWDEEMTQFYKVSDSCTLQLIVHNDGKVSMQTIDTGNTEETKGTQHKHCARLKALREKLRENWFIMYQGEEITSADEVLAVEQWKRLDNNHWKDQIRQTIVEEQRTSTEQKVRYINS